MPSISAFCGVYDGTGVASGNCIFATKLLAAGTRSCLVSFFPDASATNLTPLITTVRLPWVADVVGFRDVVLDDCKLVDAMLEFAVAAVAAEAGLFNTNCLFPNVGGRIPALPRPLPRGVQVEYPLPLPRPRGAEYELICLCCSIAAVSFEIFALMSSGVDIGPRTE